MADVVRTHFPHVQMEEGYWPLIWLELMEQNPRVVSVAVDSLNVRWHTTRARKWLAVRDRAVMLIAFKKRGVFRGVDRNLIIYLAATIFRERLAE